MSGLTAQANKLATRFMLSCVLKSFYHGSLCLFLFLFFLVEPCVNAFFVFCDHISLNFKENTYLHKKPV